MKANQQSKYDDPILQSEMENIYNIMDGKISFGTLFGERSENIDAYLVDATASSVAGDDTSLTHDLKRTPIGYLILSQSGSGDFYEGSATNTDTAFYIKCTTASTRFKIAII